MVRLGAPEIQEAPIYKKAEIDGISIWYDPSLKPERADSHIVIDARRSLLGWNVVIQGARKIIQKV